MKIFYWSTFVLSVAALLLNVGLGLFALGIIILPVLALHFAVGLVIGRIRERRPLIIISAINLLVFALIRPDGVHTFTDTGLSSLLELVGIDLGYSDRHENLFTTLSLVLLVVQPGLDIWLRKLAKKVS